MIPVSDLDNFSFIPSDIENKLNDLSDEEVEKFIELFTKKINKQAELLEESEDLDKVTKTITELIDESIEEATNKIDNWKNGLDLL